jgi:hypothetical protein
MDGNDHACLDDKTNKRNSSRERFMWSNVCKKTRLQSPKQEDKQPLSKLFASGSKFGEEKLTRRLSSDLTPGTAPLLQENVDQSNSQDTAISATEKLATNSSSFSSSLIPPSPSRDPPPCRHEDALDEPPRRQPSLNQSSTILTTTLEKSLGCWTFNPRKRKRFKAISDHLTDLL